MAPYPRWRGKAAATATGIYRGERACTVEVIDAITSVALPNATWRSSMWWRRAIQEKSV